jgi:ribonuclease D
MDQPPTGSSRTIQNPQLVYNQATFNQMVAQLSDARLIAVDTESDSLFSYYPRICLLQISTYLSPHDETIVDYIVDPLRHADLAPLGELLADPVREIIMHAAENDLLLLQREHNFHVGRVFDTQLAGRILGWERVGLAAILEEHFGVATNKRMQRTDWGRRPLTPEQLVYAQKDTHYLPALRDLQMAQLMGMDRWEEAQEAFHQLVEINYSQRLPNERTMWQMKETRSVPRASTGVLEELWEWREQEAQRRNSPPFKIVSNTAIIELAIAQPATADHLEKIPGLGRSENKRYGSTLLQVIARGKQRPLPSLPEPTLRLEQTLDRETLARYDALRQWRMDTATARGVAADIVLTNEVLLEVARRQPDSLDSLQTIAHIGPWKARTYGPRILEVLAANGNR